MSRGTFYQCPYCMDDSYTTLVFESALITCDVCGAGLRIVEVDDAAAHVCIRVEMESDPDEKRIDGMLREAHRQFADVRLDRLAEVAGVFLPLLFSEVMRLRRRIAELEKKESKPC